MPNFPELMVKKEAVQIINDVFGLASNNEDPREAVFLAIKDYFGNTPPVLPEQHKAKLEEALDFAAVVHAEVRAILLNPDDALKPMVAQLGGKLMYWMGDFQRPSADEAWERIMPSPEQETLNIFSKYFPAVARTASKNANPVLMIVRDYITNYPPVPLEYYDDPANMRKRVEEGVAFLEKVHALVHTQIESKPGLRALAEKRPDAVAFFTAEYKKPDVDQVVASLKKQDEKTAAVEGLNNIIGLVGGGQDAREEMFILLKSYLAMRPPFPPAPEIAAAKMEAGLNHVANVHAAMREILTTPSENEANLKYFVEHNRDKLGFWMEEFKRPEMAEAAAKSATLLPSVSEGALAAFSRIFEILQQGKNTSTVGDEVLGNFMNIAVYVANGGNIDQTQSPKDQMDQIRAQAPAVLDHLEAVHGVIRKFLLNPPTPAFQTLVAQSRDGLGFWMEEFRRPSVEQFMSGIKLTTAEEAAQENAAPAPGSTPAPQPGGAAGDAQKQLAAQNAAMQLQAMQIAMQHQEQMMVQQGVDRLITKLPRKTPEEAVRAIDSRVGSGDAKAFAKTLQALAGQIKTRKALNLPPMPLRLSTTLEGPEGSGKTSTARMEAELMHALGLAGGKYVEINYDNMMDLLTDKTGMKVVELFNQVDMVFLRDVSSLTDNPYGKGQAARFIIDALTSAIVKRDGALTLFVSDNEGKMAKFLHDNPTLASYIQPDFHQHTHAYSVDQLGEIMDRQLKDRGLEMTPDAREAAMKLLADSSNGSTRAVRVLLDRLPIRMSNRLFGENAADATQKVVMPKDMTLVVRDDVSVAPPGKKPDGNGGKRITVY